MKQLAFLKADRSRLALRSVLFSIALAIGLNFLIELLAHRSPIGALSAMFQQPLLFFFNTAILLITLSLAGLFRHKLFATLLVSVIWLTLGVANCVLMCMRNSPLCGEDFHIITTGFSILTVYLNTFQIILIAVCLLLVVSVLVYLYRKLPKTTLKRTFGLLQTLGAFLVFLCLAFTVQASVEIPDQFDDMTEAYHRYGFIYCFAQTCFDRGIEPPTDYSEQDVQALLNDLTANAKPNQEDKPNLIFLQLESFFNLASLQNITLSENPLPFFTSLLQSCPSGLLTVPSIGGGTANTEFEVVSGMSLDYFGIGEFPYNTILQSETVPSLPFVLKSLGYSTHVFHNHEGSFYDRDVVYPNLGFDTFTSIEYMTDYERNPLGWCDDSILTTELLSAMQETSTLDYLFAVSVQCHGKYPSEYQSPENGISVDGIDSASLEAQYRYYADQLRCVDDFLVELTNALLAYDEPVLLVLYGDHLPSLNLTQDALPENQTLYQTEYLIWSNTEALNPSRTDLTCYQLGAYALDLAGIHDGALIRLHQQMRNQPDYQKWLHTLQYDMLYGDMLSISTPYPPVDMTMGRHPISVISAWNTEDGVYVYGEGFTAHSVIKINGWEHETHYLSSNLLLALRGSVSRDDEIIVAQVSDSKTELSRTEPLIYEKDTPTSLPDKKETSK